MEIRNAFIAKQLQYLDEIVSDVIPAVTEQQKKDLKFSVETILNDTWDIARHTVPMRDNG